MSSRCTTKKEFGSVGSLTTASTAPSLIAKETQYAKGCLKNGPRYTEPLKTQWLPAITKKGERSVQILAARRIKKSYGKFR